MLVNQHAGKGVGDGEYLYQRVRESSFTKVFALFEMDRKNICLFSLIFTCLLCCCKDDDNPSLAPTSLDYQALTSNPIDAKRLCIAELLSKLLLEKDFREFIKKESTNENQVWHNEVLLLMLWDKVLYNDQTFSELIQDAIAKHEIPCMNEDDDIQGYFLDDPALVLKLPDLYHVGDWDTEKDVPFLYVHTNQLVRNHIDTDSASIVGIHGSELIDRYTTGLPNYFPLVLKPSEDYVLVDNQLTMHNNVPFNSFHMFDTNTMPSLSSIGTALSINGKQYFLVDINDLVNELNQISNKVKNPYSLTGCIADCQYECIPKTDRKLLLDKVIIHSQNVNALDYEFNSFYRRNSHTILSENICPLVLTLQVNNNGNRPWQKNLIGSFRLVDLFDVKTTNSFARKKYSVDCKTYELAKPNTTIEVNGKKSISLSNIEFANEIVPGELLRFVSSRVYIDMILQPFQLEDGSIIQATNLYQDNASNYDLYCYDAGDTLGFNSIGLTCVY
jgi:hypothetical protein